MTFERSSVDADGTLQVCLKASNRRENILFQLFIGGVNGALTRLPIDLAQVVR